MKTVRYEMTEEQESLIIRALNVYSRLDSHSLQALTEIVNLSDEMCYHQTGQDCDGTHLLYRLNAN
jgi:hypothetical protein